MAELEAIVADITKLRVDGIVNAANTSLLGGGGIYGYPIEQAAQIAVQETRRFLATPSSLEKVILSCFSEDIRRTYDRILREL